MLRALGVPLIDCQQETAHLASFGARPIPRRAFAAHLAELIHSTAPPGGRGRAGRSTRRAMSKLNDLPLASLQFYATAPYPCSYLPDRAARSQVATPSHLIDTRVYSELVRLGFRRSGAFTYRPYCDHCRACVPVRVPVGAVPAEPDVKRAMQRSHASLTPVTARVSATMPSITRSTCGTSATAIPAAGWTRTAASNTSTSCFTATSRPTSSSSGRTGVLRMVSLVDRLVDGLSSVYTFFEPDVPGASYGTYNILWQIERCRELGLSVPVPGLLDRREPKMAYKATFRPIEGLIGGNWMRL